MDSEMKKKYLSIKQMGKLRGVSSKTLRFYDNIGVFKPDYVDPETGYRYYDPEQYEKLGTILELRSLNFSLDEIKEYFTGRNMEKSAEMLKKHYLELEREIRMKEKLARTVKAKLEFMERVSSNEIKVNSFKVEQLPERYALTDISGSMTTVPMSLMHLEGHLNETAPILASDRIGFYADCTSPDDIFDAGSWSTMIMCGRDMEDSSHFKVLPAGRYLCVYFRDYTVERNLFVKMFLEYVKFSDLRLKGVFIQQFIVDITVTDIPSETIIEFQALIDDEC